MTTNPTRSLDAIAKQHAMDYALKDTPAELRTMAMQIFEAAYHEGLHTGYRQGRTHACKEANRQPAPSSPTNPTIHTNRA